MRCCVILGRVSWLRIDLSLPYVSKGFQQLFTPLVSSKGLEWTRGACAVFHSTNRNWSGFCKDCSTPLTYEFEGGMKVSIGSLNNPDLAPPAV